MLRLVDAERQAVDLAAVLGEGGGHLFGEEGARQVGDLQGAGDLVVVADGDETHAAAAAEPVEVARLGEALRRAELAEDPFAGAVGVAAVDVQVGAGVHRHLAVGN